MSASTVAVKFGGHSHVGAGSAFEAFCLEFLVDQTVYVCVKLGCEYAIGTWANGMVEGAEPSSGL